VAGYGDCGGDDYDDNDVMVCHLDGDDDNNDDAMMIVVVVMMIRMDMVMVMKLVMVVTMMQ
jgi:hypothetical protein